MHQLSWTLVAGIAALLPCHAAAAATWPSSIDELEDIMQLNTGYEAREFAAAITPCSAPGAGRIAAAEWLRTAFHDMATGSVITGLGGLDASIVFELGGPTEDIGPAFNNTLMTFAPFLSSRSSMSDLIALGVYASVRSCGGPVVPIRTGRIDAQEAGPIGVPLPQDPLGTFIGQFSRTGFNQTEMIQVVLCGHTLGGVHAGNFPQIVAPGTVPNDYQFMDTTPSTFDSNIASQYISGVSQDPLFVGISRSSGRDSDAVVFGSDGNVTATAMQDPNTFATVCTAMLQKMIEVVPSVVVLTNAIVPYDVKPSALQLTLLAGGNHLSFTGQIRVRTTVLPTSQITSVQLVYKDRNGGNACGSCAINAGFQGDAAGFDDTFAVSVPLTVVLTIGLEHKTKLKTQFLIFLYFIFSIHICKNCNNFARGPGRPQTSVKLQIISSYGDDTGWRLPQTHEETY
jgi:hypothetical protein